MAILLLIFALCALALVVSRFAREPLRGRVLTATKYAVTVLAFWVLLSHPVKMEDGSRVVAWRLILDQLGRIDATTFWAFVLVATGIKVVGMLSSMYRWILLLRGQGIEFPFRHIFGAFLIGRAIGTFLPSTAGLDGYTLYDASRFSGRTVEAAAAKALEKVLGVTGIFLTYLVALPFGFVLFGENALTVAALTVPVAAGLIAGLLIVLWYPGFVQWFLEHLPIPGRAQLEGFVLRISRSVAAYRNKRSLVLAVLGLSFLVHFTTAAMYYFTARAIGATSELSQWALFWAITLGSSIQILATVVSPFTIAGEGVREFAQYLLLGSLIGPAAAIVSAALGFWAAEAPTMLGFIFWWIRGRDYRPAYCRVNGEQVDYAAAAKAALELETDEDRARRAARAPADVAPFGARVRAAAGFGLGAGLVAGVLLGAAEALVVAFGGFGEEAQVLWYGPLAYAAVLGGLGLAGGAVLAILPMERGEVRGWTPTLVVLGGLLPFALFITLFRLRRDVYLEQMPPLSVLLGVLAGAGLLALAVFVFGRRFFASRASGFVRPLPAAGIAALVVLGGGLSGAVFGPGGGPPPPPPAAPPELAGRPNIVLIMVDTLRADHLSCYGAEQVSTPHICSLAADAGGRYTGFSHASWTKPATASLVTGTLPSTHNAMSKPAVLADEITLVSESLRDAGYTTGGIVSNVNLAPSFGFAQGYDEYHYLAPDYIAGADESSSKLILYQLARRLFFRLVPGLRVGDFYQDSETVNRVAVDWLERHRESRFFLFLHYMDPHDPYFEHGPDGYTGHAIARVSNQHPDPELAAEMKRLYRGEIEYLDERIGRLLDRLRRLGLYDDALIVLTSDHGEEFFEHGGFWHGLTLYDEQIRVPLLVKWPRGASPGPADGDFARLLDVAPTLIAAGGGRVPDAMAGLDLAVPLAERSDKDRMAFAEEDHEGNVLRALRTETWKLIEVEHSSPKGPHARVLPPRELFDVRRDPGETENLYEVYGDVAADLRRHSDAHQKLARAGAVEGGAAELSSDQEAALRALGYLE